MSSSAACLPSRAPLLALALLAAAGCSAEPTAATAAADSGAFSQDELTAMRKSVKTPREFRALLKDQDGGTCREPLSSRRKPSAGKLEADNRAAARRDFVKPVPTGCIAARTAQRGTCGFPIRYIRPIVS